MSNSSELKSSQAVRGVIQSLLKTLDPQAGAMEFITSVFSGMDNTGKYPSTVECEAALADYITSTRRLTTALRRFRDECEARE